ncbi:hypothetical protein Lnau_1152 [Legionella nautarum]|uniref:Uncharacterized protein n=1 Tax=Legionella nautarum TaxID=45070 RepID=A0A0W0WV18_9GAMM|nr:hypothetical protein [Legionella nautarum]KTD36168.1 hypothetical protein Lnau_1152 [Legionella nautarum]
MRIYMFKWPRHLEEASTEKVNKAEYFVGGLVLPLPKIKEIALSLAKTVNCEPKNIQFTEIFMSREKFIELRGQCTYLTESALNTILEENEKHKPRGVKPLSYYAAKSAASLTVTPDFFSSQKITAEAKEQIEEAFFEIEILLNR